MISWNPGLETFGTILPAYGNAGDLVSGVWFGLVSGRTRGKSRESASLIGHLGSSTFRLSTAGAVSMSLAGSCFSSESAPGPLYGVFFVKEFATDHR
jgi:hypothetical protein